MSEQFIFSKEFDVRSAGNALLNDYKRLQFENDKLTARIAELEAFVGKLIETGNRLSDDREYQDDLVDIWHDVTRDWKEG